MTSKFKSGVDSKSRNSKKSFTQSNLTISASRLKKSPTNGKKQEKFKMPDCLKELVEYKNSEDF